ncbi:transporter substrate-binding domain-containing protein [Desulfocurvus sp.]|jgi:polar amino acid transport system substrate-binding protein|uniref:substrate-binding periplasmic protein n=1 Tax=Desulfocurvus sp. TaxID=2871698 RepID=UPI0025BEACCD|nr:transporter substrate-binding domain-containing protein [Desulfocurvus sp.]MCK9239394.1 transporter substrate-binding domain-containing protein [Desulfocurvus sp.]
MRPVLLLLLMAALLALPPAAGAGRPLRIAYPEFWPFFFRTQDGSMDGFFHDIVTEALERRLGVPLVWECYPWVRCQERVRQGESDAMITVPTAGRAAYAATHPTPFYSKKLVVFTSPAHPRLEAIRTLRSVDDILRGGFSVVTYIGNGWAREKLAAVGVPVTETSCFECVWPMLAVGRADLVVEWPVAAWAAIRSCGLQDRVVQTQAVLEAMPFHLLIGKNSPHVGLLAPFERTLEAMRADGTLERIVAPY